MAQIGSPPAGWYTDPSGQHRARYWDGTSWTEQVRDDLTGPGDTGPGGAAHPAAETVAGVAEAAAAVAANDLVRLAPLTAEPTSVTATEPTGAGIPDGAGAFGPPAGWYPDPASRHEARLWDGTRWTERVADHGIESIDALPGTPVAGSAAVDPTVRTWSPDPAGPIGPEDSMASTGSAMSAGQISLGSLPEPPEAEETDGRRSARPSVKVRVAGAVVLGGAVALLFGSTMPWMQVRGPKVGDEWSSTGLNLGDGRITVALALVLAVLGAAIVTGRMARFGGTKVAAMGVLVAGAAALAVTAVDIADVADRATRLGVPAGAVSNVGDGLWLAFLGALVSVVGGLMAFANRE